MAATWQAGATSPPIRFTITEGPTPEDMHPLDLTNITVSFRFGPKGQPATWERECTKDTPLTDGKCHCDWEDGDLAESGDYEGQLVLDLGGGDIALPAPDDICVARSMPAPAKAP